MCIRDRCRFKSFTYQSVNYLFSVSQFELNFHSIAIKSFKNLEEIKLYIVKIRTEKAGNQDPRIVDAYSQLPTLGTAISHCPHNHRGGLPCTWTGSKDFSLDHNSAHHSHFLKKLKQGLRGQGRWRRSPEGEKSPDPVSYTHLTLPTSNNLCRSRWSPYH